MQPTATFDAQPWKRQTIGVRIHPSRRFSTIIQNDTVSFMPEINARNHFAAALVLIAFVNVCVAQQPALEFSKWSGTLNVPDPVAISFDNRGRAYVTQTKRRKANDLDIRANTDWIVNDVSFQSVEEKRLFYHKRLTIGENHPQRVQDLNGDGNSDYKDLMVLSEQIHQLKDTDGDGLADSTQVFAEGFNSEITGIAAGVLHHNGDVYTTIAPDVWKLTDTNDDGTADSRQLIATGFGLHIAYAGHDMHGLTVGPDGKIYWTIGDKGISATSADGQKFHYPNQGGVMRCNPDGTDFEVFAHGLRNVQELAFDQYGNLFGVDNDSDKPNERERFVYIVKDMDAGWRCNYQYRGDKFNPWTDEQLWFTHHEKQAAYIIPPIKHSINGPAGFAFNPGTAIGPEYHNYFFLTGAPGGPQIAFQVKPNGASFDMINEHNIGNSLPIVGINFGPDGALYGVDWGGGYPLNQTGAVWKIDNPLHAKSTTRIAVQQLLADGFQNTPTNRLGELLAHADQRIRLNSQFELVRRGEHQSLRNIAINVNTAQLGRIHAMWGLGQLNHSFGDSVSRSNTTSSETLIALLQDADTEIQCQAARLLADAKSCSGSHFRPLLDSDNDRLRFMAMMALADHPTSSAFAQLTSIAAKTRPSETYLRHAVAKAMAACGTPRQLGDLHHSSSTMIRLCAVVALRHQKAAEAAEFLEDTDVAVAEEAARAIHDDFSIVEALPNLAASLLKGPDTDVFLRRAINANYRLGGAADFRRLVEFSASDVTPLPIRLEALDALATWQNPVPLDRVTGRHRTYANRVNNTPSDSARIALSSLLDHPAPDIQAAAMKIHEELKLPADETMLSKLATNSNSPAELVTEALNLLAAQQSSLLPQTLEATIRSPDNDIKMQSLEFMVAAEMPAAHVAMVDLYPRASSLLRQRIVRLMAALGTSDADNFLISKTPISLEDISKSKVSIEIMEVLKSRAGSDHRFSELQSNLTATLTSAAAMSPDLGYAMCLTGGDPKQGKLLFNTHLQAQCVRCHRVGNNGSTVGPDLRNIAQKRNAAHLLRAIIAPSADIDPNYRSVVVVLASGKSLPGIKLRESKTELTIADSKGKEINIALNDIDDVVEQNVSIMPDMSKALSPTEIRNLLAYLMSLN